MPTILGIDLGASTTDFVLFENNKIKEKKSIVAISLESLEESLKGSLHKFLDANSISITGGKSASAPKKIAGLNVKIINEIDAIGAGGLFLSGKENAIVASLGTGTCIVDSNKNKFNHMKGTGLSGGTVAGLCSMLGISDYTQLNLMAEAGTLGRTDITVEEITGGSGIGVLPKTATASNLARVGASNTSDVIIGILNTVAQVNSVIIWQASQIANQKNIVITGKLSTIPVFQKLLIDSFDLLKAKPIFSEHFEVATAVGAAKLA